jgi:uncharacterized protein (TIGR04255 family)
VPRWPNLSRCPITEALLDIRVQARPELTLKDLEGFQETIADAYPQRRTRQVFEVAVADVGVSQKQKDDGFLFVAADGRRVIQARLDGFSFSLLKPYSSWDALRDEGRRHWESYRQIVKPSGISRVAVRYINRIELPLPFKDFREYILTAPEIAQDLPQGLANFLLRVVIPVEQAGCVVIVTETMEPPDSERLPFILDIDASCERPLDPETDEVWETLERLRDVKNDFFFRNLTPKALELFK